MLSSASTRFQLDLRDVDVNALDKLMADAGIEKRADLLNNALSLLHWAIEQRNMGKIIASVDEENGSYKELSVAFLNNIN